MINLDTHVVVFALTGDLTARERQLLSSQPCGICDIVLWELAKLVAKGRISLDLHHPDFLRFIEHLHVWPITRETAALSTRLDFHSDPADELIAATSIIYDAPLLTRDLRILRSHIVPFAVK